MILAPSKQIFIRELKSLTIGVGTFAVLFFILNICFIFLASLIFQSDHLPTKLSVIPTSIGALTGLFVAYQVNDKRIPISILILSLVIGGVFYVGTSFIGLTQISGKGMEPSYKNYESVWVNYFSPEVISPKRGLVVIAQNPTNSNITSIKRIIGLPGEKIQIIGNLVIVNNNSWFIKPSTSNAGKCYFGGVGINNSGLSYTLDDYQYLVQADNVDLTNAQGTMIVDRHSIVGQLVSQRGNISLSDLPLPDLQDYKSANLKLSFSKSSACQISESPGKLDVKEQASSFNLISIALFAKNPDGLSTEEWLKKYFKIVESVYCKPDENCKLKSGDKLLSVNDKFKINGVEFVTGTYKDVSQGAAATIMTTFAANDGFVYSFSMSKEILKAINFN